MSAVKVVELKDVTAAGELRTLARFVQMLDGSVRRIDVTASASDSVDYLIGDGVFAGDRIATPDDGLAFLIALSLRYQGSRLWATDVFELDEADALRTV